MKARDYYAILGIPPTAFQEHVDRAYKRLVTISHPDVYSGDRSAEVWANERMKQINEAFTVLRDPARRSDYDRTPRTTQRPTDDSSPEEGSLRCPACEGEGETLCLTCAGVGAADCPGCHGRQSVLCPACQGRGMLTPHEYERLVEELLRAEAQSQGKRAKREDSPQPRHGNQDLRWSVRVPRRNPETATILSVLLPGAGQLYNGEARKALTYLSVAFILFLGVSLMKGLGVLLWLSFWAYNVFDAYSTARGRT